MYCIEGKDAILIAQQRSITTEKLFELFFHKLNEIFDMSNFFKILKRVYI